MERENEVISRHVLISELPECYFKEQLERMVVEPSTTKVWVVAKEGMVHDFAAYIGWPSDISELKADYQGHDYQYYVRRVSSKHGVLAFGDKLDEKSARELFPEFEDFRYRR